MDDTDLSENESQDDSRESPLRRLLCFALAFAILAAYSQVIDLASQIRDRSTLWSGYQWNWLGKGMGITFSCLVLACWPWLRQNVGLRWRQSPGSAKLSVACLAVYLAGAIGSGMLIPPMPFSAETLLFQYFMPGIDEELLIRGIMLALLERSFGQSPMSCRLRFGYAAWITSLVFGLAHGLSTIDGHYQFSMVLFLATTLWAALAALVRTRSGSLLWPVIYHGVWNGTIFLMAMLR